MTTKKSNSSGRRLGRKGRGGARRDRFERLEDRRLLACDAWISLGNMLVQGDEMLRVEGDGSANRIDMRRELSEYIVDYDCNGDGDYTDWADGQERFDTNRMPAGILFRGFGGNDTIRVNSSVSAAVTIEGGDGDDFLSGGAGNDTIRGGAHADTIRGNAGNDNMQGGTGNDRLDGGTGADVFNGGDGTDTADYSLRIENLKIDLDDAADDGAANELDNVQSTIENVWGGYGNDLIIGSGAANELKGNGGNDELRGGGGGDKLFGGEGDDYLYGQAGDDYLYGGKGNDKLDGGLGSDFLFGESGKDTLYAGDGFWDRVDGGTEVDVAYVDNLDVVFNVP